MTQIVIEGRAVGTGHPPYIVAELSANHGGSFERAIAIIDAAADAGVDAIKFQAYTAQSMTLDCDSPGFVIDADSPWKGQRLYDLYARAATPYDWLPDLYARARNHGLTPFASPFDPDAVEVLERLDTPVYKIASFEACDLELIKACAKTGKPMIVSTGLCSWEETEETVAAARQAGCQDLMLLKCISNYPAKADEAKLLTIPALAERFGLPVGFSDHTLGTAVSAAACALGASLIEKHFIDCREPPTPDSMFSLLPAEMAALVTDCRDAFQARGGIHMGPTERERACLVFRRSLVIVKDIPSGGIFTRENLRCLRPGHGLAPKHLDAVLGKRAVRPLSRGQALTWDMIDVS